MCDAAAILTRGFAGIQLCLHVLTSGSRERCFRHDVAFRLDWITSFLVSEETCSAVRVLSGALIWPCEGLQKCCLSSSLCSVSFILALKFAFSSGLRGFSLLLNQGNYWLQRLKLFKNVFLFIGIKYKYCIKHLENVKIDMLPWQLNKFELKQ